ncbi:hypothetical protein BH09VER1_BH09VER1_09710 [soil metagenome]
MPQQHRRTLRPTEVARGLAKEGAVQEGEGAVIVERIACNAWKRP